MTDDARTKRQRELELLKQKIELQEGLPFLHGWPWYTWAHEFFTSTNRMNFLCAANQVSKSSTQIRKCIHWATAQDLWPILWRRRPVQFWYMYPSSKVANAEFLTKWSQFLPRGKFKDDPYYGWKAEYSKGDIVAIHFNSGVHVFFKTYKQGAEDLQTGSVDALFLDEELPEELWDELAMRVNATDGYIHMVFTATLGQDFWRQTMEPRDDETERFPTAKKWTVSLYDSQHYMDGAPSIWTDEKIAQVKAKCKTHAEFLKRVMGRFILVGGKKYEAFDATRHMKPKHPVPKDWLIWEGVDIGGGGEDINSKTHKAAICFVAVRPDFRAGRVFLGWRGDGVTTTAGDVFQKHLAMKREYKLKPIRQLYDWANKDFGTIAARAGEPFEKADKGHDKGEDIINTLFKNDMLFIYEDAELAKLAGELSTLLKTTAKNKAKDDFCFVAGTLIATPGGPRPIESLQVGDWVHTRKGPQRVLATTCHEAEVVEYIFDTGAKIACTPEHGFFVAGRGFQPIQTLTHSDTLYTLQGWQNPNVSCSGESSSDGIRKQRKDICGNILAPRQTIEKRAWKHFIEKSGKLLMVISQRGTLSTTSTETQETIAWQTLTASLKTNTQPCTCESGLKTTPERTCGILRRPDERPPYGIAHLPGEDGIPCRRRLRMQSVLRESVLVHLAGVSSPLWMPKPKHVSVQMPARQKLAGILGRTISRASAAFARSLSLLIDTRKQKPVLLPARLLSEGRPLGKAPVYNITVEHAHEYFANGVLVSNCDAFRYAVTTIPWDFSYLTGEVVTPEEVPEEPLNTKQKEIAERRKAFEGGGKDAAARAVEEEFDEWNDAYGG